MMDGDIGASPRGTGCYYVGMCVRSAHAWVDGSFGEWLNGCAERVAYMCENEKFLFALGSIISRLRVTIRNDSALRVVRGKYDNE